MIDSAAGLDAVARDLVRSPEDAERLAKLSTERRLLALATVVDGKPEALVAALKSLGWIYDRAATGRPVDSSERGELGRLGNECRRLALQVEVLERSVRAAPLSMTLAQMAEGGARMFGKAAQDGEYGAPAQQEAVRSARRCRAIAEHLAETGEAAS